MVSEIFEINWPSWLTSFQIVLRQFFFSDFCFFYHIKELANVKKALSVINMASYGNWDKKYKMTEILFYEFNPTAFYLTGLAQRSYFVPLGKNWWENLYYPEKNYYRLFSLTLTYYYTCFTRFLYVSFSVE